MVWILYQPEPNTQTVITKLCFIYKITHSQSDSLWLELDECYLILWLIHLFLKENSKGQRKIYMK